MRSLLDRLYLACGALAALFLVAIALLVLLSIIARLMSWQLSGLSNYAGYCMAAASFLALAYTFGQGGHIRVTLLINRLQGRRRQLAEIWCLGVGFFMAAYFAYYSVKMVQVSHLIHDVSQGPDASPLWIPQLSMALGTTVLAIALLDRLIAVLRGAPVDPPESVVD
ncbi:MAG: TRAP transporter small permease [Candidatus Competibacteraceae bacterium]|nr:TRAP transporter small permease [Candidatus Competibacteraceae bacterium]MCB1804421.1 TRAP transporter small permease [Candidatus Competibacteraceae bacterium]MCB1811460.1 TRAP transporter small permease [Candidatus Competibacteraceae bacterium]